MTVVCDRLIWTLKMNFSTKKKLFYTNLKVIKSTHFPFSEIYKT
jgi:hypothetical protein